MHRSLFLLGCASFMAVCGCVPAVDEPKTSPSVSGAPGTPPPIATPSDRQRSPSTDDNREPRISWDTERDRTFAEFLREKSGGMLRQAAVGLERRGVLRIELDQSVAPEDTLDLTKSIMAGARRDFPDRPITLSVYDPGGSPILKAHYRPGQGVQYQIAHEGATSPGSEGGPAPEKDRSTPADPLARGGVTEADRKFASWAEDHGRAYLRYVEADLEKHGRLWFGVTRDVKPADVPELTRSLLEGAQKEFPRRDLVATVFDPEGERIGKAHLGSDGRVRWDK